MNGLEIMLQFALKTHQEKHESCLSRTFQTFSNWDKFIKASETLILLACSIELFGAIIITVVL
jgi:hypothetical protein